MNNIREFINILPDIFIYITPGYLFVETYKYTRNLQRSNFKKNILEYIMVSFCICSVSKWILGYKYDNVMIDLPIVTIVILVMSTISGYLYAIFIRKFLNQILKKLKINHTINLNILSDMIDKDCGTWARVYLNNEKIVYYGAIKAFDKKDNYNDGFIVLNQYKVYNYGKNDLFESVLPTEEKKTYFVSIKMSEISRIETIYDKESSILSRLLVN